MPAPSAQAARQDLPELRLQSTALVPVAAAGDAHPQPPGPRPGSNVHVLFFAVGYTGLALVWAGAWLTGFTGNRWEAVTAFGAMFIGLGGFGILIHTLYRPSERKVRHLLLALGSLALTTALLQPVSRVAREMYAAAAVNRLQTLAVDIAKDARIQRIGIVNGNVVLNDYWGGEYGMGTIDGVDRDQALDAVLRRDGMTRAQLQSYMRRLRDAGMHQALRTPSTVAFDPDGPRDLMLVHVLPGRALPPAHALVGDGGRWHSEPLGGSWHMAISGHR